MKFIIYFNTINIFYILQSVQRERKNNEASFNFIATKFRRSVN